MSEDERGPFVSRAFSHAETVQTAMAIRERWGNDPACPMCKGIDWTLVGKTFVPLALSTPTESGRVGALVSMPSAAIMCKQCGDTRLVNLYVLGVLTPDGRPVGPVDD